MLSRACVPKLFTTGLIVPILKKSTLNPNVAQNYRPITLSSIHSKMVEALILQDTDLTLGFDFARTEVQHLHATY